jgi:hypothetical protein
MATIKTRLARACPICQPWWWSSRRFLLTFYRGEWMCDGCLESAEDDETFLAANADDIQDLLNH